MRNLLLLALLASLLITSACKKSSTNPSGTNGYGTYKLGDSTYKVYTYNYLSGFVNINPDSVHTMNIVFSSRNTPPAVGNYLLGYTTGQALIGVRSNSNQSYRNINTNQNLTITQPSNGYLNFSTPTIWVYPDSANGNISHIDSLPFSMNVTIPN